MRGITFLQLRRRNRDGESAIEQYEELRKDSPEKARQFLLELGAETLSDTSSDRAAKYKEEVESLSRFVDGEIEEYPIERIEIDFQWSKNKKPPEK